VKRARSAALGVLAALVVALAIGHRTVWVLIAETRLRLGIGKANPALETILASGNDAALARLARFVVMERNAERGRYAKRQLEGAVAYDLKDGTRPLIAHLLRLAAAVDDDGDRGAALETIGALAANEDRMPVYVQRDGELYFYAYYGIQHRAIGAPSEYPSFFIAERAPRPALFAWADWLVAHGRLRHDDPVLAELGPPPPPYDGPPRIGVVAENLVVKVVLPDLPADRAGILPNDRLCTLDGAPITELSEIGRALAKKDVVVVVVDTDVGNGPVQRNVTIRR
jgi:hypothetical protein